MLRSFKFPISLLALSLFAFALNACAVLGQHRAHHGVKPAPMPQAPPPQQAHPHHLAAPPPGAHARLPRRYTRITPAGLTYRVGTGDRLRIKVFGEPSLSSDYAVDGAGHISMPLIASVPVAGRTTEQIQALITARLKRGFLRQPSVAVEVLTFRPFYILGEVNTPGKYPYVNGITVENAIAIAGGHTPRARKRSVRVARPTAHGMKRITLKRHDLIQPGDTITVRERFF